jgi:hypothetical protein
MKIRIVHGTQSPRKAASKNTENKKIKRQIKKAQIENNRTLEKLNIEFHCLYQWPNIIGVIESRMSLEGHME